MSFKPNLAANACHALPGHGVVEVSGPDAAAFLQAQSMNDVAALAPGHWHWNGLLTPKGRVVALFALVHLAPSRFLMVLPDFPADELATRLKRFVFRSKVALQPLPWVAAAGPSPGVPAPDAVLDGDDEGLALDMGGEGGPRGLWLLPAGHPALAAPDLAAQAAWLAADLEHGLPRLPEGQREAWTPQMLSLERLAAFSLKKGCYPGQEIVARTHYLGQAKRGLVRLAGEGLQPGLAVDAAGQAVGTVVSATADGREGLAVLGADAPADLAAGGRPCGRLPLREGLHRPA
ncbi:folate-binding protein YgfZ [Arenimonas sp.]|uniref:CAF17-like 4Fe-4S cluster assembly/insertion protein YgfZ n=1 Tax=Arenimonas sp. TaxID=1872635 RepID=UPI0035B0DF0E